jgi:ABC-type antimicrobial peptide transport system permease subunit
MDRLSRDLRHAIASLVRDRSFAAIGIVTLALGIGANTAVFSLVKTTLLSPLPYGDADRLTVIWGPDRAEETHLSLREVETYPREAQSFAGIAGYQEYDASITAGQEPELIRAGSATPNSFDVIGAPVAASAALSRTMSGLVYGVATLDPLTFIAVPASLSTVALVACLLPARRAATVDPVRALRQG